jgi:diguanylate cyclase (GGDEF)-like protein
MSSSSLRPYGRARLLAFAIVGIVLPVLIAADTDRSAHHPVFYVGAVVASVASIVSALVPRRRRVVFCVAAFGQLPALTLMQAYSGGAGSSDAVLVIMAILWFGLGAGEIEMLAGILVFAACCVMPMVLIGAPAYPLSWGHAGLLVLVGMMIALSLRAVTRELETLAQRFAQEAVVDDLTGLLNRRGWRYTAPRELARAARSGNPITLVTLDLDNFKELNDELGHAEGDRALSDTAERIRATLRAGDVVARLGGDEFVALLTNSTLAGSLTAVDRLRASTPNREAFSAGVAVWDRREDLSALLHRSDVALYAAKEAGAGRTEVAPTQLESVPAVDPEDDELEERLAARRRGWAGGT